MKLSRNSIYLTLGMAGFAAVLWMFWAFSPEQTQFFPKCPFKMLTGFDCPSCGVQRAFHAALHGDFSRAVAYNPFMLISLPYAFLAMLAAWGNFPRLKAVVFGNRVLWGYVVLFFAWWIIRNL